MKIALYGTRIKKENLPWLSDVYDALSSYEVELYIHRGTLDYLVELKQVLPSYIDVYDDRLPQDTDYMITLGGDGTILRAAELAYRDNVPLVGINMGHLGFLAAISKENIGHAIDILFKGEMTFEEKILLEVRCPSMPERMIAINEVAVSRKDSSSMIAIEAYADGHYIATYRGDGLIVSTPTGSTGYSLSCGGPIITPATQSIVLTPVASHNLNVRPIIFRDDVKVYIKVSGREDQYLLSLDSCFQPMNWDEEIEIFKSKYTLRVAKMPQEDFFSTMKEKLGWGSDERN